MLQEVLEALQHERDHAHGAGQVLARTLSSEIARSVADQAGPDTRCRSGLSSHFHCFLVPCNTKPGARFDSCVTGHPSDISKPRPLFIYSRGF